MKITKRQLRRIIKEEKAKLLKENPSLNTYLDWVKAQGHVTPASASVIASFLISRGIESLGHMRVLGDEFGIPAEDIERDFNRQQEERAASLGESKTRITKKQLRQIIQEELSVIEEATRSKPWAWELPGSSIPGHRPDYGEGNLTIADVQDLFPALSRGEQDDIWEKYKHLNNAGELKAAILGL